MVMALLSKEDSFYHQLSHLYNFIGWMYSKKGEGDKSQHFYRRETEMKSAAENQEPSENHLMKIEQDILLLTE